VAQQPLTWTEMRTRAHAFVAEWRGETRERAEAQSFWNDWFSIFGISRRRSVTFEQHAQRISTGGRGNLDAFWPGVAAIEHKSGGKNLEDATRQALDYLGTVPEREMSKLIIASDFSHFRVLDLDENATVEFDLAELPDRLDVFAFVAGYHQRSWEEEPQANIAAAELMGRVFDQLEGSGYPLHALTRWLVRLLFCLFADDTGIWQRALFHELVLSTRDDGRDVGSLINELYEILNTPEPKRYSRLDETLAQFPYVNGGLFAEYLPTPAFTGSMRTLLLECCEFDWSAVSPAVFDSMFQAVLNTDERRQLGAHYTSEQSILKALEPLFLDELRRDLANCRNVNQLRGFCRRLGTIRIIDPAMGCGNFLVVAYRELCLLELDALIRIRELTRDHQRQLIAELLSQVDVDQFYGIEIEEFPACIAEVALYLVDHQANMALSREFGEYLPRIPLKTAPHIHIGNALSADWRSFLPPEECSYVVGNPPFRGKKIRTAEQQADMAQVFAGWRSAGNLDYVAAWYVRTFEYIRGTSARAALVSTNSICQGEQVELLWPRWLDAGLTINFARRTFIWTSEARGRAAVHVVIVGFSDLPVATTTKMLYDHPKLDGGVVTTTAAKSINPYLVDAPILVVSKRQRPLARAPAMRFGSMPNDDSNLLLTGERARERVADPVAASFLRRLIGSHTWLHGVERWCLWVDEHADPALIRSSPELARRAEKVREYREISARPATQALAAYPLRFGEVRQPTSRYLFVPRHRSQNRRYVPMDSFGPDDIAHDSTLTVEGADEYLFGVLSSDMFTSWLATVGGRIKSDFRLSAELVYNTFPFPDSTPEQRARVTVAAQEFWQSATTIRMQHSLTCTTRERCQATSLRHITLSTKRFGVFSNRARRWPRSWRGKRNSSPAMPVRRLGYLLLRLCVRSAAWLAYERPAICPCLGCGLIFCFDPDRVPAIRVEYVHGKPVMASRPGAGTAEPVCPACARRVNPERIAAGFEPIPEHDTLEER
jgi:hypothetical protein